MKKWCVTITADKGESFREVFVDAGTYTEAYVKAYPGGDGEIVDVKECALC